VITDASAFSGNFAEQGMFTDAAVVTITTAHKRLFLMFTAF
jgi:hypothetical protein